MKTVIALLFLNILIAKGQVLLSEGFTKPFNPNAAGWNIQNLSAKANPTINWFQGSTNSFASYDGGPDDFLATDFLVTNGVNVTLSNWLITPTVTIVDGSVLSFATRCYKNPTSHPDRLEVYYSTAGTGTNVGNSATSVGTFSTMLVSINPSLTSTGYPGQWTVYTATISGVSSPVTGRIGFRYFVTNGGQALNSDYIGLDAVVYKGPCSVSVPSYTICSGNSVTLNAIGDLPVNSYTWSVNFSNASSVVVNPSATTTYSLIYTTSGRPCPVETATVTIGNQLSINFMASKNPICIGETVTLTALSAATNYSWSGMSATAASIIVNPGLTAIYSISATAGNSCIGSNTFQLFVYPVTNITTVVTPSIVCSGRVYSVSASGGLSFNWYTGGGLFSFYPLIFSTPASAGIDTYTITSINSHGCTNSKTLSIQVYQSPTVSIVAGPSTVCLNTLGTYSATGGVNYNWKVNSVSASTLNPFSTTFTVPGSQSVSVLGYNLSGCSNSAAIQVAVRAPSLTVQNPGSFCVGEKALFIASGATTFSWSGSFSSTKDSVVVSATQPATYTITLSGTDSAGCIDSVVETYIVDDCLGVAGKTINGMLCYPNPAHDVITFTSELSRTEVYDEFARLQNIERMNALNFNISCLPKGLYHVLAYDANGLLVYRGRIVKD